jgi:signal transduction histidine kinase
MSDPTPIRLLVVDDEAALMDALRKTLRDEGYQVTGATSGEAALAVLKPGAFDILLTDLMMPRMDGIELLRRALAADANLVGLVMTGQGSIPTAVEAMKTGAIDYVLKPFKLSTALPALERAMMLRRLRVKNAELEERVRRRTAELEDANHELDAFCHSVSHDLRTPLRALSGFTEILRNEYGAALPPDPRRLVDLIHAGAGEMDRLTNALLDFSRLGRQALARKTVDLASLSREVIAGLAGEHAGRRVEFQVATLPAVSADAALLRPALTNLLANALKYTRPRDPAVIEIGVASVPDEPTPAFFVRDNGVGFDPHYADRLFGVFQRLHHAHEFEGTGVGLATVRRIIERHGGRIWAESAPGAGATFWFTLPPAAAEPGAA